MKYHIGKHGLPSVCKATKKPCPLGGDENHFDTLAEAERVAQKRLDDKYSKVVFNTGIRPFFKFKPVKTYSDILTQIRDFGDQMKEDIAWNRPIGGMNASEVVIRMDDIANIEIEAPEIEPYDLYGNMTHEERVNHELVKEGYEEYFSNNGRKVKEDLAVKLASEWVGHNYPISDYYGNDLAYHGEQQRRYDLYEAAVKLEHGDRLKGARTFVRMFEEEEYKKDLAKRAAAADEYWAKEGL